MAGRFALIQCLGRWKESLWLQIWGGIESGAVEGKIGIVGLHDGRDVQEDFLLNIKIFLPNCGFSKAINLQIEG